MSKRLNPNHVKMHRSYTVIEASEVLDVHPKSVRNWIKAGLTVIDESRPLLIHGSDLKVFLKLRRKAHLHQCGLSEMYCFNCKSPKQPNAEDLTFIAKPAGMAQMTGRCSECGSKTNKYVSWRDVNQIWIELGGKLPIGEKHLILRETPLANYPLSGVFGNE